MRKKRTLQTNGQIQRLFKSEDAGSMIRKNNLRRYVKQSRTYNKVNPFDHITYIDTDKLIKKLNPNGLTEPDYMLPRVRTLEQCVALLIEELPRYHLNEHRIHLFFFNYDEFFKFYYGNKWIINYDELKEAFVKHLIAMQD